MISSASVGLPAIELDPPDEEELLDELDELDPAPVLEPELDELDAATAPEPELDELDVATAPEPELDELDVATPELEPEVLVDALTSDEIALPDASALLDVPSQPASNRRSV